MEKKVFYLFLDELKGLELFPNNTQFLLIKSFVLRKQGEYENALNNLLVAYHTLRYYF